MEDGLRIIQGGSYEDLKHELTHGQLLERAATLSIAVRFAQLEFEDREEPEVKDIITILTLEKESFVEDLSSEDKERVSEHVKKWEESRKESRQAAAHAMASALHDRVGEVVQRQDKGE